MNIERGKLITVINNSGLHLFNTFVIYGNEEEIAVRLTDNFAVNNFFAGSKMSLAYEVGKEFYIINCTVYSIIPAVGEVLLKIDSINKITNKRMRKRYPVLLFAEVYSEKEDPAFAYVINVSLTGLSITSRVDYNNGVLLGIDIFNGKSVIRINAEVVWKFNVNNFYKYGLKINTSDEKEIKEFRNFLKTLSNERKKASK